MLWHPARAGTRAPPAIVVIEVDEITFGATYVEEENTIYLQRALLNELLLTSIPHLSLSRLFVHELNGQTHMANLQEESNFVKHFHTRTMGHESKHRRPQPLQWLMRRFGFAYLQKPNYYLRFFEFLQWHRFQFFLLPSLHQFLETSL